MPFACLGRAQKRIAQQRIDSKMDLGQIVDIRKKIFSEVKVCPLYIPSFVGLVDIASRNSLISAHKLETIDQYPKYDSHLIMKFLQLAVGLEQSNCGMSRHAHQFVLCGVRCGARFNLLSRIKLQL